MSPHSSLFFGRRWAAAACALVLAGCNTPAPAPSSDATLQALSYAGSKQPLVALDARIAAAGLDPAQLDALATRLLALVRDPATSFAARQAICERLGSFPATSLATEPARRQFAAMLTNEHEIDLARLALERVPGQSVDALFLDALQQATPATRLALIQSAGNRTLAGAVPVLAAALRDSDPRLAAGAARALGQIGAAHPAAPATLASLRHAPDPYAPVIAEAELTILAAQPPSVAAPRLEALASEPRVAAPLRAAALRQLLVAQPDAAPARFAAVLAGTDPTLKPVVIEAIASHPARDLTRTLAASLPSFDPGTRAAVVAALGHRGGIAATRAVADATRDADADVRTAAIVGLADLPGTPDSATCLAGLATSSDSAEAKLARQSLARLNGPGVADAILDGARRTEPPVRLVYIDALAARSATDAVPLLLGFRAEPNAAVRASALGALAELAPASEQATILAWALAASDPSEQSRALRALAAVSLRAPDRAASTQPIVAALEQASPAAAERLVPVLGRLGGPVAANCAVQLAGRGDSRLARAAIAALARWTDASGLAGLIAVAERTADADTRATAVRAALDYLDQNLARVEPAPDTAPSIARLLTVAVDSAARTQLVFLLGRCRDDAALALAEKLQVDPALGGTAAATLEVIRANRLGAPVVTVSAGQYQLKNLLDGNVQTRWSASASAAEWVQLDFRASRPVRRVVLEQGKWTDEFPARVEVCLTDDAARPGPALASADGQSNKTTLTLPAGASGRYLLIRHVGERVDATWTIAEVLVD